MDCSPTEMYKITVLSGNAAPTPAESILRMVKAALITNRRSLHDPHSGADPGEPAVAGAGDG